VAPERIIVTAGSSAALLLVMALLVNRDDRILLADPGYPCNRNFVRVLEGEPVGIPVGPESNYQLTAELIARHWTPATRGALIASPSNPTGTVVPHDEMRKIVAAVAARGGQLIVDEIYLGLTYGLGGNERPHSVLEFADNAFVLSSFSKYFNMTGWRLGWLVAPERHVRDLEKLAQNLYISPATPSQRAALACFEPATLAILEERRRAFEARRDFLVPALRELGFTIPVMPTGGFFVYADCSAFTDDSTHFCRKVLDECGVAFTPGVDFGRHRAAQHVRFAYTIGQAKLEDGVARLAQCLRS
jgi:aspartate/methionine/tyrosine aminotransferase